MYIGAINKLRLQQLGRVLEMSTIVEGSLNVNVTK